MTEKLYYQDAYRKEFTAVVQQVVCEDGQIRIQLDQTAFYPEGGGQGADKGVLWMLHGAVTCAGRDGVNPGTTQTMSETRFLPEEISEEIGFLVTDVQERDGEIWHYISACLPKKTLAASMAETDGILAKGQKNQKTELPVGEQPKPLLLCPGQQVWGQIDWERRFDHMQQHSGEHIISGMICRRFHCDNVGFHMGEDAVTVDFNARISYEQALEIEAQANAYIWEDHPFQELWPTQKELEHLEYRSKKELPGAVRITCFPGADSCACCGTHVSGSAQIGLVKFLSAKPFHDGTRLELLCGKRAFDYLSMNYYENKAAAVLLSAHEFHTAEYVRKMLDDNLRQKAANAALKDHLLHQWAESFRGQGDVLVVDDQLEASNARPLADLIADCCRGRAAVFVRTEEHYQYAVIQRNTDITEFIRSMNQSLNGKGGGRNGFAQGSVCAGKEEIEMYFQKCAEAGCAEA